MSTPGNSINEQTTGICGFTGTSFTGSAMSQYRVVLGSSTSSTLTQVSGTGNSGDVLTSNGAGANPTWQPNGASGLAIATGSINSTTFQSINTSPVTILASPGSGKSLIPVMMTWTLKYGGHNAFGNGGDLLLYWSGPGSGNYAIISVNNSSYQATTNNTMTLRVCDAMAGSGIGVIDNSSLILSTQAGNPGGNAAGDNSINWSLLYYTITT